MDIDRFRSILEEPSKTKTDLLAMRENALKKRALRFAQLAEQILDARFPGWRTPRGGGGKPTEVIFRGQEKQFYSEKEAYFWLMERFIQFSPKRFEEIDWERDFVARAARTRYFSKSLETLFLSAPTHASDPNKFYLLKNGWYAKTLLTEKQKLELLLKFSHVAALQMGKDWDWNGYAEKSPTLSSDEILRGLDES